MLILTRSKEQAIIIGDNVKIKVIKVSDGKVRLAVDAPPEIEVHREEVYQRIKRKG